jgi:hypothetical protein
VNKFFHIGINYGVREPNLAELAPVFNKALDWIRYASNCWVVYTSSELGVWYQRLKPVLHDDDSLFICEIAMYGDGNSMAITGYLPMFVWEWFRKLHTEPRIVQKLPGAAADKPAPPGLPPAGQI